MTEQPDDDLTALNPAMPIVDPHHHLWDGHPGMSSFMGRRYLWPDFQRDVSRAHNIVQTIAIDCGSHYRPDGPEAVRPVGETEFFAASGREAGAGICAGIVSHADLTLGDAVAPVLEAHIAAGDGRFRGIRHMTANAPGEYCAAPPGLMASDAFRRGFARLADHGLSFDAYVYHTQLDELADLARAFPGTTIILDHMGSRLGTGAYAHDLARADTEWKAGMTILAACPNIVVKLGGLGAPSFGSPYLGRTPRASTQELADEWRPLIAWCIDRFTADRCMFESNFPVDSDSCGYTRLWNVFQTIAAPRSQAERSALFHGTARRIYRLPTP